MANPTVYLTFDGDCAEAFEFYADVLDGKIEALHRFGASPMAAQLPPEEHDKVMHALLRLSDGTLMGSDALPGQAAPLPSGFHLSLNFDQADDARAVFDALAEDGEVTMPLQATFWAAAFGTLVDRFGVPWMINCESASAPA